MLSFTNAWDRDFTETGETMSLWLLCEDEGGKVMVGGPEGEDGRLESRHFFAFQQCGCWTGEFRAL